MKGVSLAILVFGAAALVSGIVVRAFQQSLSSWGDVAMVVGGLCLVAFLWIERLELQRMAGTRQVKYGANSVLYSLVVVAIIGSLNFVASRHVGRLDLTEDKLYTLSEQTRNMLEKLPREVTITAFFRETAESRTQAKDILTLFEKASDKVNVEMVDPDRDPRQVAELDIRQYESVLFRSGKQRNVVTNVTEEAFANAIAKVASDERPKVYFVEGHGEIPLDGDPERGLVAARHTLVEKSFEVAKVNLANVAEIPRDASMIVLADPQQQLGERGIATLERYLQEGGRALLLLEPERGDDLGPLLERHGIDIEPDLVIDPTMRRLGGPGEAVMVTPGMLRVHPITKRFMLNAYLLLARSVSPLAEPPDGITVQSLFECSAAGWAETSLDSSTVRFDADVDRRGPIALAAVASWKPRPEAVAPSATPTPSPEDPTPGVTPTESTPAPGPDATPDATPATAPDAPEATPPPTPAPTPSEDVELSGAPSWPTGAPVGDGKLVKRSDEGRLVVVGDASWASDTILPDAATGNASLFVNVASWLTDTEELIGAPPRKPRAYHVRISREQGILLVLMTLFALPGAIFVYGMSVWWRRRRL